MRGVKLTVCDLRRRARARQGRFLSKHYRGARVKHWWRCKLGHRFSLTPANQLAGSWCPICAFSRGTLSEMRELAKARSGRLLSRRYVDSRTHLRWKCSAGHIWWATPANVKRGSWCPACAKRRPIKLSSIWKLARGRKGKCLSTAYVNARTPLLFRCRRGHKWKATPDNVRRGSWCPICSQNGGTRRRGRPRGVVSRG